MLSNKNIKSNNNIHVIVYDNDKILTDLEEVSNIFNIFLINVSKMIGDKTLKKTKLTDV